MAAKVKLEMNSQGVGELLKSAEVQAELKRRADRIAAAAGPGHEVDVRVGRTRARASVVTATREARKAEAESRRLTSSLDAGRGD